MDDETVDDDITNSESLNHASDDENMSPCSIFKEDGIHKDIDHGFFLPPILLKEEDVINDAPS